MLLWKVMGHAEDMPYNIHTETLLGMRYKACFRTLPNREDYFPIMRASATGSMVSHNAFLPHSI